MGAKEVFSGSSSLLISLLVLNSLCAHLTRADGTVGIVCYGYSGASYVNNTRCPGSNACCGYEATCLSNRLCHNPGDAAGTYVRGPCANNVWDETCAQVCLFNETILQGFLPRVSQCSDGSWCCSNDATCCSNSRGVFLDSEGNTATTEATTTISYPPVSGTGLSRYTETISTSTHSTISAASTSSSSTTLSSATSLSTTSDISSPTSSASTATDTTFASTSSPNEDNSGTKVGLSVGLGIPLAALLAGGSVWCFLRRKKRPQGSHPSGSDPGLRHGFHVSESDEGLRHGSHSSGSDEGLQHGFYKPSAMPPATSPKIELSGEGKSIHELQSLSRSPGYQRQHYSDSQSPDLQSRGVSYELA